MFNRRRSWIYDNFKSFSPKNKPRVNLNRLERQAIKELKDLVNKGRITIYKADKGGMVVVMPPDQVRRIVAKKITSSDNYKCVGKVNPFLSSGELSKNYTAKFTTAIQQRYISMNVARTVIGLTPKLNKSTLDLYKPATPYFYINPKIHKFKDIAEIVPSVEMPARLVTALNKGFTLRGDKYILENFLGPLARDYCRDMVKDTTEFLRNVDGPKEEFHGYSVAIDVVSLYDNIRRDLIMEGVTEAISHCRPGWPGNFVVWLIDMINFALEATYAKFEDDWYKMENCLPTGHTLSVDLADMGVYKAFYDVIYSDTFASLVAAFRFVDDGTLLWEGSLDSFFFWIGQVQEMLSGCGLEITYEVSDPYTPSIFLDVKYHFEPAESVGGGRFVTNISVKPTDAHNYLPYNSCHPRHVFRSVVYSQAIRYRRIINDDKLLDVGLRDLAGYFIQCGYPKGNVWLRNFC